MRNPDRLPETPGFAAREQEVDVGDAHGAEVLTVLLAQITLDRRQHPAAQHEHPHVPAVVLDPLDIFNPGKVW